jgi:glycosyltransferase involved in cell wall biosynthesis
MRLSVLIATYNREPELSACIRSVLAQSRQPDEVIVVDQSPRPAEASIAVLCREARVLLRYVHAPHLSGATTARNHGIDLASGEFVLFLDDDIELDSGYIATLLEVFEEDRERRVGGAGGLIANLPESISLAQRVRSWLFYRGPFSVERDLLAAHFHPPVRPRVALRLTGGGLVLRREVLERFRFDEAYSGYTFGEDRDLTVQISRQYRLLWVPAAQLVHKKTSRSRIDHERFCELRIISWLRFYDQCVEKTVLNTAAYVWLNIGFLTLLFNIWDWAMVRGTARGLWRLTRILLGFERLETALQRNWRPA